MLRQYELALMNAICNLHISVLRVSPVLIKELRLAMVRRTKKPAAPAGWRSTTPWRMTRASQKFAGMRKANELATPANLWSSPTTWRWILASARQIISYRQTSWCRQPATRTFKWGETNAILLARPVAPSQPSGTLKYSVMESDPSQSGISFE